MPLIGAPRQLSKQGRNLSENRCGGRKRRAPRSGSRFIADSSIRAAARIGSLRISAGRDKRPAAPRNDPDSVRTDEPRFEPERLTDTRRLSINWGLFNICVSLFGNSVEYEGRRWYLRIDGGVVFLRFIYVVAIERRRINPGFGEINRLTVSLRLTTMDASFALMSNALRPCVRGAPNIQSTLSSLFFRSTMYRSKWSALPSVVSLNTEAASYKS